MYDYRNEPHRNILMIDNKSFYASVESVALGLNPLEVELVVMSNEENTNGGLILASSPMAKRKHKIKNVMRYRDLPTKTEAPNLIIVEPHMNLYIQKSDEIIEIFRRYVADEDLHVYSIDESILDITDSYHLFGPDPISVAREIQQTVLAELGIYTTVGIGDNPLLAKLALDLEAKKNPEMLAVWHYHDVAHKLWPVDKLTQVWSINRRTEKRLRQMGIQTMFELAHTFPRELHQEFGIIGEQLFALSWGVDRSILRQREKPQMKSYGNSQVLPRDYVEQREIEIVIREIGEQVAARIRHRHLQAKCVSLGIGFSESVRDVSGTRNGFHQQSKITATNLSQELVAELLAIFRKHWHGEAVRHINVSYSNLITANYQQLNLFADPKRQEKNVILEQTTDGLRKKFGFKSAIKASSLSNGGTAVKRMGLVGGHRGGNSYE